MKKDRILLLLIFLLAIPTIAFARIMDDGFIIVALPMEAFVTAHMTLLVLLPLSKLISKDHHRIVFWILFIGRIVLLLFIDFFITSYIAWIDFIFVFIGAAIVLPISHYVNKKEEKVMYNFYTNNMQQNSNQNNNQVLQNSNQNNNQVSQNSNQNNNQVLQSSNTTQFRMLTPADFGDMYNLKEEKFIEEAIRREIAKAGIAENKRMIPGDALRRKIILKIIFALLVFASIVSVFFHFPIATYVAELLVLIIFLIVTRKFNLVKYLKKQIKARPNEKITNVVMNAKATLVADKSIYIGLIALVPAIILPLIIFATPKIIYEKVDGGYAVRYYIYGLTEYKTATIPETHNNEKVVSLRGNTFSNMFFLEKVTLPDTVVEIRGQAFKNCFNLTEVNIPKNLTYLGGGAFFNARSIKRVELPDTLTEMGGETFSGASLLEYVRLSENITEIRGNTFENCRSLKEITIPDKVVRIGGHAFYGNSSLETVTISAKSKLSQIGSSAFRRCSRLRSIVLPRNATKSSNSFKDSPTTIKYYDEDVNK